MKENLAHQYIKHKDYSYAFKLQVAQEVTRGEESNR